MRESSSNKPNLPDVLFWDWDISAMDWQKAARSIIERVLERGTDAEQKELIRFYGRSRVIKALKEEIVYLPDFLEEKVCRLFKLRKEQLKCYERKQSRRGHWI